MMIKVYELEGEYHHSQAGEYIVISESGMWEHEHFNVMERDNIIRWLYHNGPREVITKYGRLIKNKKRPRWLNYFLSKYAWMFNDPFSWRSLGNDEKEINIEYKWKLIKRRRIKTS